MGLPGISALVVPLACLALQPSEGSLDSRAEPRRQLRARMGGLKQHGLGPSEEEVAMAAMRHPAVSDALALSPTQYYGVVRVGDPVQELRVVFDTSSGELILPSSKCSDPACEVHRRFAAENSTSALQIGWADDPTIGIGANDVRDTRTISLLGSDVSGEFVRDRVCVGSTNAGQFCGVTDFIMLMEEPEDPFQHLEFDGVLGLAPRSADAAEFNFLTVLLGNRTKEAQLFSLYLANGAAAHGELLFGGLRREYMASELIWAPISENGTWHIRVEDVAVGGKATRLCGAGGCQASIDTGSSLIMSPGNMLWAIVGRLGVDDDCTNTSASLGFVVGGQLLELERGDYLEHGEDGCRLMMAGLGTALKGQATLVLGYPFLRRFYTVFDLARQRIGFARARQTADLGKPAPGGTAAVQLVGLRP